MPRSYGHSEEEHLAVREGVGVADLSHRGKLLMSGKEHIKFLHGMVTNNVMALEGGSGLYAAMLTPKGRMITDMNVYKRGDSFLLDLEPGLGEKIRDFLLKYRLSYKASVEDVTESLGLLSVHGIKSKELLKKTFSVDLNLREYSFLNSDINGYEATITKINRTGEEGFDIYVPAEGLKLLWEKLNNVGKDFDIRPVGLEAMESLRIEVAIPRYGVDMDENTIPQEAGIRRALSFDKGCYVGQEVIIRIEHRGHVNRHLLGLFIQSEKPPAKGDRIFRDEHQIGEITSGVFSPSLKRVIALGYIRREFSEPGTEVSVFIEDVPKKAEVVETPFYKTS